MLLKIFALSFRYFLDRWNIFDLVVLVLSFIPLLVPKIMTTNLAILRVFWLVRVGKVLRVVEGATGLRAIILALRMALPGMVSLGLILFFIIIIFAIIGTTVFGNVKLRGDFDDVYNFSSFFKTVIVLFSVSTSGGFDGVLAAIFDDTDCKVEDDEDGVVGDCGSYGVGILFLVIYYILS